MPFYLKIENNEISVYVLKFPCTINCLGETNLFGNFTPFLSQNITNKPFRETGHLIRKKNSSIGRFIVLVENKNLDLIISNIFVYSAKKQSNETRKYLIQEIFYHFLSK